MANDHVSLIASALLQSVIDVFAAASVTLPDRQYTHVGQVADDNCEQLVVSANRIERGAPGIAETVPVRSGRPAQQRGEFQVRLTRCAPGSDRAGQPPDAAALSAKADEVMIDGWVLWDGLVNAHLAGNLVGECQIITVGPMLPIGPLGQQTGWVLPVVLEL